MLLTTISPKNKHPEQRPLPRIQALPLYSDTAENLAHRLCSRHGLADPVAHVVAGFMLGEAA